MTNPRRSFNRSWGVLCAAGALSLSLALAGCSSDANGESPTSAASQVTSGSASASNSAAASSSPVAKPQEATPTSPAKNIPEPVMPAAAKKNTAEGLEAFTRYWFEVHNYAQKTGDTKQMMALCVEESDYCKSRRDSVNQFTERNAWMVDGQTTVDTFFTQMKVTPGGYTLALMEMDQKPRYVYNSKGAIPEADRPGNHFPFEVYSKWNGKKWEFLGPLPIDGADYSS